MDNYIIKECSCEHEEQDKLHGKGKRVFNVLQKDKNSNNARCTVCGKQIVISNKQKLEIKTTKNKK